ncbi:MAG: hypothetical protein IPK69_07435 [Phycisphaerales bacterium]|nr:MAG: hypothetical protein IPK69_07435 [Phycisphaerales bacterium]
MRTPTRRLWTGALPLKALSLLLLAGALSPITLADPPAPAADPLAGPRVPDPDADRKAPTLIERDADGHIKRLEITAEEVALDKLKLTAKERRKANEIVDRRRVGLDRVVIGNVPLIIRLHNAAEAGDKPELKSAFQEFIRLYEAEVGQEKAKDQIAEVLSREHATQFNALIEAYWKSIAEEALADANDSGITPAEAIGAEIASAIGKEIKRSYERQVQYRAEDLDHFLEVVEATPKQESTIRAQALEFAQKTLQRPTIAQREAFIKKVFAELTPAQRAKVMKEYLDPAKPAADTPGEMGGSMDGSMSGSMDGSMDSDSKDAKPANTDKKPDKKSDKPK